MNNDISRILINSKKSSPYWARESDSEQAWFRESRKPCGVYYELQHTPQIGWATHRVREQHSGKRTTHSVREQHSPYVLLFQCVIHWKCDTLAFTRTSAIFNSNLKISQLPHLTLPANGKIFKDVNNKTLVLKLQNYIYINLPIRREGG